jgi:hypothetical protein
MINFKYRLIRDMYFTGTTSALILNKLPNLQNHKNI